MNIGKKNNSVSISTKTRCNKFWKSVMNNKLLYLMLLPGLIFYILFRLKPFLWLSAAFFEFNPIDPQVFSGEFVGLQYFKVFFQGSDFMMLLKNTLILSVYNILFFFPVPIILALLLNEVNNLKFKKIVQTVTYIPHFFSWVVIAGISYTLLTTDGGGVNNIINAIFGTKINFLSSEEWFRPVVIMQQIWKDVGWGTIVYLAAMASIDPVLYEAASMDGATRWRKMISVTLPSIAPTIAILLILRMGSFMDCSFEQLFLMVNTANQSVGQVFDTYIYQQGISAGRISYTTAAGIFKSVISLFMVVVTNKIAKKLGNEGIY